MGMTEVKWTLIFCASMLLWMALERAVGLHDTHIDKHIYLTNLFSIVAITVFVLALRDKKRGDYQGTMTYLQGLRFGATISLMIAVLSPGLQWIISTPSHPTTLRTLSNILWRPVITRVEQKQRRTSISRTTCFRARSVHW